MNHSLLRLIQWRGKLFAGMALRDFIRDYRVLELLTSDGAAEQVKPKMEFMKQVRKYGIVLRLGYLRADGFEARKAWSGTLETWCHVLHKKAKS
jgi:hypothetical protein